MVPVQDVSSRLTLKITEMDWGMGACLEVGSGWDLVADCASACRDRVNGLATEPAPGRAEGPVCCLGILPRMGGVCLNTPGAGQHA